MSERSKEKNVCLVYQPKKIFLCLFVSVWPAKVDKGIIRGMSVKREGCDALFKSPNSYKFSEVCMRIYNSII